MYPRDTWMQIACRYLASPLLSLLRHPRFLLAIHLVVMSTLSCPWIQQVKARGVECQAWQLSLERGFFYCGIL